MRKLTLEYIKKQFEKEGYKPLIKEYVNAYQRLNFICPNGHLHSICWVNWQQGNRCSYCSGKVKKTIEFVKLKFEKDNYILLTKKYINNKQKLDYVCPNGHKHSTTWNDWQQGKKCGYCYSKIKLNMEFIKSEFEKEEYTLLTDMYIDNKQKLKYICPNGHKHSISWNVWKRGIRCSYCTSIKISGSGNPNWKGGVSCEPYCDVWLDKEFKESIKERDNYGCQNSDCWGISEKLSIHHIDYDKKNCKPDNLITLCNSCNSRANKNRKFHEDFYSTIMYKRGYLS